MVYTDALRLIVDANFIPSMRQVTESKKANKTLDLKYIKWNNYQKTS